MLDGIVNFLGDALSKGIDETEKYIEKKVDDWVTEEEIMKKITAEELRKLNAEQFSQRKKEIANEIREERKQEKLELEERKRREEEERREEYLSNFIYSEVEEDEDIENMSYDELKDLREKLQDDMDYEEDEQGILEIQDKLQEIKIHERIARIEEKIDSQNNEKM